MYFCLIGFIKPLERYQKLVFDFQSVSAFLFVFVFLTIFKILESTHDITGIEPLAIRKVPKISI